MREINVSAFLTTATDLRQLRALFDHLRRQGQDDEELLSDEIRLKQLDRTETIIKSASEVGARMTSISAQRFHQSLNDISAPMTAREFGEALKEIEGRFVDELQAIRLYVVTPDRLGLLDKADRLLGTKTASAFPSAHYDIEEAAKCLLGGRATASVFHSMRVLEIAIKAFARRLHVADPTKPAQRNWAVILKSIRSRLDELHPQSTRSSGSEGGFLEGLLALLEAVRNPWRNSTIHVEQTYTEEEAGHILIIVSRFLGHMSSSFDENGDDFREVIPRLAIEPDSARAD